MSNQHPEHHVYEEPRNDFMDVGIGFGAFFGVLFVIAVIATVIQVMNKVTTKKAASHANAKRLFLHVKFHWHQ